MYDGIKEVNTQQIDTYEIITDAGTFHKTDEI